MDPTTLDAPFASESQPVDVRRVSPDPIEGYVLDPWSGLYQETETTYQHRLQANLAVSA
jgi:hypothetical protein